MNTGWYEVASAADDDDDDVGASVVGVSRH